MKYNLKNSGIIYVFCPAQAFTGGPEAMHQLVDMMRRCGLDARLHFLPAIPDPTILAYAHYDTRYAQVVEDRPEHVMIVPEVMTHLLDNYTGIQKAVWWLSAVNHLKLKPERQFDWSRNYKSLVHFTQSYYAEHFVQDHGVRDSLMLTEYLHERYLVRRPAEKKNQVAYFAKKNAGVIDSLIEAAPDITWVPIQNMTPEQVREVLSESKIYADFGPHPGRDRMPREAAMQNCCVLVGDRGAAAFEGDFPFPAKYKFEQVAVRDKGYPPEADPPLAGGIRDAGGVIRLIRECFENFEKAEKDFEGYRVWIRGQKDILRQQVVDYFSGGRYRAHGDGFVKARNTLVYYRNKVVKRLTGYTYVEKDE